MPKSAHFSPKIFKFLRDLKTHNDRDWFNANKGRYEEDVKAPLLAFIADFGKPLEKISEHFVADPRPTGGSMFRIYRDTRFSKDKSPYKTQASAHFRHARAKDVHAPGFYLHLEPGNVFAGAGIWRPESKALVKIRDGLIEDPKRWKRAIGSKAFKADWELGGERYVRPPRGVDKEHELIDDLLRKDFIAVTKFKQKEVCSPDFIKLLAKRFKSAAPMVSLVTEALELKW